jgi:hypothetical protein
MRASATILLLMTSVSLSLALASTLPLTTNEIGLMLRSGYSSQAVLQELAIRKFAGSLDPETEKQLLRAGATADLIDGLRNSTFQASADQVAEAQAKLEAQQESRKAEQEAQQARRSSTATGKAATGSRSSDLIYRLLKGDLIYRHQGALVHFDDESLEHKKFYLFYFSSVSSAPARKFTPQLIEYYKRVGPEHPEFEVIFFSGDRSQFGMESYIAQTNMPWPAVAFDKVTDKAALLPKDLVKEIPFLVLVDASGTILAYGGTEEGKPNVDKVLADTEQVLAHGPASILAQKK